MNDSVEKTRINYIPILVFVFFVYIAFLLYQSVYFNYKTSQKIKTLKEDIISLEQQKTRLEALIAYYKTDTFAELEARKKLGLKMPGEKVVKVNVEIKDDQASQTLKPSIEAPQIPNWQKWINFLQGKDF